MERTTFAARQARRGKTTEDGGRRSEVRDQRAEARGQKAEELITVNASQAWAANLHKRDILSQLV